MARLRNFLVILLCFFPAGTLPTPWVLRLAGLASRQTPLVLLCHSKVPNSVYN